jgi:hypothetical protein
MAMDGSPALESQYMERRQILRIIRRYLNAEDPIRTFSLGKLHLT